MSKSFRLQRLDNFSPQERRKRLLGGVIMTVASALVLLAGLGNSGFGVLFIVVGVIGLLFFAPLTGYVASELFRIHRAANASSE
jgi:hypothetical protein